MKIQTTLGRRRKRSSTETTPSTGESTPETRDSTLPLSRQLTRITDHECTRCPLNRKASSVCVAGDGQASLPVLVLGEAPGFQEDTLGKPFVGAAGKLLRGALQETGLNPNPLWLTNAVKCYPQGTPTPDEIDVCSSVFLSREIEILKPAWILALGRSAATAVCVAPGTVTEMRGKIYPSKNFGGHSALVFPAYHPAYVLRARGTIREQVWRNDLELFATLVKVDCE